MSQTKPIKNGEEVEKFKNYYLEQKKLRNYALLVFGLNTALRISDLLNVRWGDVYDFEHRKLHSHLTILEGKTHKTNSIALNSAIQKSLQLYLASLPQAPSPDIFLFKRPGKDNKPICRSQAYRIVRCAAEAANIQVTVGCHSMRKTFGYHACKQGVPPAVLMNIYNHSSYRITLRYLDIDQDDKDEVFSNVIL